MRRTATADNAPAAAGDSALRSDTGWTPEGRHFHTRRRLLLAGAALPLAAALPSLPAIPLPAHPMTVGEAIAWLHLVAFRSPVASRHD